MSEASSEQQNAADNEARETGSIMNFMAARKIGTAMWVMRLYLVFLSIQYMFFCSAFDMGQYFQRAMIANAIVCALRLHQRVPEFRFTREHLALLLQEDSCHYLIYSLIFCTSHPITIALMPVVVFAILHASNFTRQMFDVYGTNSYLLLRKIINTVAKNQAVLFRFVALNEVLLMPTTIFMLFGGKATVVAPFLYYKFLSYRYVSRRNPYSRMVFYELRVTMETFAQSPSCPGFLTSAIHKVVSLCYKMAPAMEYQQQPRQPQQQ